MRSLGWLLIGIILSTLAGSTVAVMVGQAIRAQEELILVFFLVPVVAMVAALTLEITRSLAQRRETIDRAGLVLLLLLVGGVLALWTLIALWSSERAQAVAATDLRFVMAVALPCLATILVQWWLVRRRWPKEERA